MNSTHIDTARNKLALIALVAVSLLTACASQPDYRAADGRGYGYTEQQLSSDQYRVSFKARGDDTGLAMDYAMLRASELTLEEGYDWYDIASRETLVDRERVDPGVSAGAGITYTTVKDCGLLGCRTYQRPSQSYHTGMHLGDERSDVEVIMEIRLGNGMRPSGEQSYDAREVYQNLKPQAS
ncbi:CC0125/CC1285 family lipoprotein [Pseudohongiella sp.]|uniref:Uncharacterized protein n=1 Tax=marine sediment metagenome TaxID=412755 RepID=A0A0F9W464_9ZZZZ|nr:hypothetical protein [Pseudohongiella sp.]HDZ07807.1 hypothetical protein [Pseudohongiella sp.]HEA62876.1 hypothetical protein [Pseudohongiella sp.]